MGLRARLALFFVAIVVVPLTIALVAMARQSDVLRQDRATAELTAARRYADALLFQTRRRAADLAADVAAGAPGQALADEDAEAAEDALAELVRLEPGRADVALLVEPDGDVVADARSDADFAEAREAPSSSALARAVVEGTQIEGALLEVREIRAASDDGQGRLVGFAAAGTWLDEDLLAQLGLDEGAAFCVSGRLLAGARSACNPSVTPESVEPVRVDGAAAVMTALPVGDDGTEGTARLLLWRFETPSPLGERFLVGLFVLAVLAAGVIGWVLAGGVVAPVRRSADVARAVAAGDLERKLQPSGGRELADLAGALNTMSSELALRMAELERSRDELRGSLTRLGETLSSSLDLNRTLSVVTETAMDTLGADRAALLLLTPEEDALYTKVGRGVGEQPPRLKVGEGLLGWVAETAVPVRLPADRDDVPEPLDIEVRASHQLAVPMLGRGRVLGVLSLLRDADEAEFSQPDLDTIRSFAAQASVAIENVLLHREAQRLSVTDTLTGLWNFRYFRLQAERELESAARFDRPLGLLIVDIDHFKEVNDRFGHQAGDEVLAEVALRIRDSTRVPDVVARYGGEEFVVLLPGTPIEGAVVTAERIRNGVGGSALGRSSGSPHPGLQVTCSIGVAVFPDHGPSVAALLRSADAAMYTAKARGRNRVVVAGNDAGVALG